MVLFVMLLSLFLTGLALWLAIASGIDLTASSVPRYVPYCSHGGKLLRSAWWQRDYCVSFHPGSSASSSSTPDARAETNATFAASAENVNLTVAVTEWGPISGSYPADMHRDPEPYRAQFVENPTPVLAAAIISLLGLVPWAGFAVVSFMAELEANFVRRKEQLSFEEAKLGSGRDRSFALTTTHQEAETLIHKSALGVRGRHQNHEVDPEQQQQQPADDGT